MNPSRIFSVFLKTSRLNKKLKTLHLVWFLFFFVSCSQSFDETNAFKVVQDDSIVEVDIAYWDTQCESCHQKDKIADSGSLRYWANRSQTTLADYITTTMPYGNPGHCEGICATETAKFLQAVLTGATIVDAEGGASFIENDTLQDDTSDTEKPNSYESQCASCHLPEKIVDEFAAWRLQSSEDLAAYISMTMPFANADACVDDCATESADYILSVLDGKKLADDEELEPNQNESSPSAKVLPIAPTELALLLEEDEAILTWQDNSSNEESFTLWRKVDSSSWTAYESIPANTEFFKDEQLPSGRIFYRISAKNSAGTSALSDQVLVDLTPMTGGESCMATNYVAGTRYSSGQIVTNENRYFECKTLVAAWCSSTAAWAYEPVNGLYWGDAWTEVSTCDSNTETQVALNTPTLISAAVNELSVSIRWLDNAEGEAAYLVKKSVNGSEFSLLEELVANSETFVDTENNYGTTVRYLIQAVTEMDEGSAIIIDDLVFSESSFSASAYYATDCAACHGARGEGSESGALQINAFIDSELDLMGFENAITNTMPFGNVGACVGDCSSALARYIYDEFLSNSTVPEAVSGVIAVANASQTLVNISWSDNSDIEVGFRIERSVNAAPFEVLATVNQNETAYVDEDVVLSSEYQYRVTAFNQTDVSVSVTSSSLRLEMVVTLPFSPTNLLAEFAAGESRISWTDNANNETNYVVQRRKNKGNWSADVLVPANQTHYIDTNVMAGNAYEYRVLATNAAGDSPWSDVLVLDLTAAENRIAFETNCSGCHKQGGIAVDLLDGFTKNNWVNQNWERFTAKVNSMPVNQCDDECRTKAATYVWSESWGLELSEKQATNSRGVRGLRLLTSYEYSNVVRDVFGFEIPSQRLPADRHSSDFKYASEASHGSVIYDRLNEFLLLAEYVAGHVSPADIGCDSSCTDSQLTDLLSQSFRQSIDASTLATYKSFQATYGLQDLVSSILLSPLFLYRSELGEWDASVNAYRLNQFEIATALSFQLWGTTPSPELLEKANRGELESVAQIESVAAEMIENEKAAEHFIEFVKYYTHTQSDLSEKPDLSADMIAAMEQERNQSVRYAMIDGEGTLDSLFNPNYSFLNEALASHYDIESITGSNFRKVSVDATRGGLLHQGLLQVHTSDFTATSLVKRGKLIRENMMCHAMGVPSGVDPAEIELPEHPISTRERWDVITGPEASDGQCWACHQLMNEPGSVLESYSAAGQFRLTENAYNDVSESVTIETAGLLRSNDATEVLLAYDDARDLSRYLANSPVGQNCFVDNYVRFSSGYEVDGLTSADVNQWQTRFRTTGEIWPMVLDSIKAESFIYRLDRN